MASPATATASNHQNHKRKHNFLSFLPASEWLPPSASMPAAQTAIWKRSSAVLPVELPSHTAAAESKSILEQYVHCYIACKHFSTHPAPSPCCPGCTTTLSCNASVLGTRECVFSSNYLQMLLQLGTCSSLRIVSTILHSVAQPCCSLCNDVSVCNLGARPPSNCSPEGSAGTSSG